MKGFYIISLKKKWKEGRVGEREEGKGEEKDRRRGRREKSKIIKTSTRLANLK